MGRLSSNTETDTDVEAYESNRIESDAVALEITGKKRERKRAKQRGKIVQMADTVGSSPILF